MSTTATPPATPAATPPPVAPPAAVKPVTPAIPEAQKQSAPAPAQKEAVNPKNLTKPVNLEADLKKLSDSMLLDSPPGTKPAEAAPAKPEPVSPVKPVVPATSPAADEPTPFDHIKPEDGMSEKSLAGWKALKKTAADEVARAKKEAEDFKAKLSVYEKATPADTAEAARLKEELKQANDRLAVLDVESTPDFRRQFVEPKKKALSEAQTLLADNGMADAPDFTALMTKPRADFAKAVSELAAKMQPYDQGSFVAAMREAYKLQGDERAALGNASELKKQIEAKNAALSRQAFDETKAEFSKHVSALEIPSDAAPEKATEIRAYNEAVADAMKEAERYSFGRMSERDVAQVAQRAAALKVVAGHIIPSLTRERDQAVALNRELAAELSAIKAAKNPGQFKDGGTPSSPDTSKMDLHQLAKAMLK